MYIFVLLARRGSADSPINQWLAQNPLVLGLIAISIGAVLAGSGIYELRKGVAHDQYGNEMHGTMGQLTSIIRVLGGLAACTFGLYKMIAG